MTARIGAASAECEVIDDPAAPSLTVPWRHRGRLAKEYLADEIDRILADRPSWGPRRAIAGFFDDGIQAWVSEGETEPGGP